MKHLRLKKLLEYLPRRPYFYYIATYNLDDGDTIIIGLKQKWPFSGRMKEGFCHIVGANGDSHSRVTEAQDGLPSFHFHSIRPRPNTIGTFIYCARDIYRAKTYPPPKPYQVKLERASRKRYEKTKLICVHL